MNIYNLKKEVEAANTICETLTTEERIKLEVGINEICDKDLYDEVKFWG